MVQRYAERTGDWGEVNDGVRLRSPNLKTLQKEISDKLAQALNSIVKAGWFPSEAEAVGQALNEFVQRHRLELTERFQRDDIAWALDQASKAK